MPLNSKMNNEDEDIIIMKIIIVGIIITMATLITIKIINLIW